MAPTTASCAQVATATMARTSYAPGLSPPGFPTQTKQGGSPPTDWPREVPTLVRDPAGLCPGDERLRAALDEMWISHQADLDVWKRSMTSGPLAQQRRGSGREARDQWKALAAVRERLPTLSVLVVDYPVPTVMTVPPTTLLIAPAIGATAYTDQLVAGALALTAEGAAARR